MSLKDTTKLLSKLRVLMKDASILNGAQLSAYIVPSSDAHGSEYLSEKDQRRKFISGFSGSAGTAVVTEQAALLWTDGRYYLQASQELDSNWTLMKDGLVETPSIGDWLCTNLPESSNVGIDATLYEENLFSALANKLKTKQIGLKHVKQNLIDTIWQEHGKPVEHFENLIRLDSKHTGKRTSEKLAEIRLEMSKLNVDNLVVTSLDEIAWLLNMRGRDIPFGTVFFAYLIISQNDCKLFTELNRLNDEHRAYLRGESNFEFYGYKEFYSFFEQFVQKEYVHAASKKQKLFLSSNSNHAIHSALPQEFVYKDLSILARLKIVKNDAEIESAKGIHIRDSVTLVEFFHLLDRQFSKNQSVFKEHELNEFELGKFVDEMRARNDGFFSPSFETISSFGPNGSIIHYKPKPAGSKQIDGNDIFLLDSGGHYSDMGTTDVTRTVFLGDKSKITSYQRECFTRVLKGHIQLSMRVFPSGTRTDLLDSFARQALWQVGLDYRHGKLFLNMFIEKSPYYFYIQLKRNWTRCWCHA
jgi:Xaa-Pro aminopeptidase